MSSNRDDIFECHMNELLVHFPCNIRKMLSPELAAKIFKVDVDSSSSGYQSSLANCQCEIALAVFYYLT